MTKINNIAKNTSYLTLALIMQKVLSFTYFTILGRYLMPEDLGKYYVAISFTTIFAIFIDFGLFNVLTREVAKFKDEAQKYLSAVLAVKIPMAILVWLLVVLLANALNYPDLTRHLIYLSSVCMILDSFTTTFYSVVRGYHNLKYESIASIIFQLVVMVFGLLALSMDLSLPWILSALVMASVFNFSFSIFVLNSKWNLKIKPAYDFVFIKKLMRLAVPFGLYAIFQRFYMYLDTVLLSGLAGDRFAGLYQIPFKIVFALQFLPMAFTAALYPAMSSYWKSNKEQLAITFERAMKYLIIISLPISIGIASLADKIILVFKQDYIEAVLLIQIIIMSLLFVFINYPIGSLLNACDKQKINTINMGIVAITSIVMNFILIPRYQAVGASITVLITNILMFALGIYHVPKIIKYDYKAVFLIFSKALFACGIMGVAVYKLRFEVNIIINIFFGAIIYLTLIYLLGAVKKNDLISIYHSFIKKQSSI